MGVLLLGAHMSIAGGVSRALERGAAEGMNAIQLFTKSSRQWVGPPINPEDVARWNELRPRLGIQAVVSHAAYLINLASPKDDLWEKSLAAHRDELERAHAYGIPHVVLHPGSHTGSGEEAGMARVAEALNRLHQELPHCQDVRTLLELMAGQGSVVGYRLEQLAAMMEQVEDSSRVGVCLDTCHALAAGYEFRTEEGYAAFVQAVEATIGLDRVHCWHFNDSQHPLGSRKDRHTHIGQGQVGLEGFRHILNDPRWDGIPMLLETPKDKDGDGKDHANLRRLIELVEDPQRIPPGMRDWLAGPS